MVVCLDDFVFVLLWFVVWIDGGLDFMRLVMSVPSDEEEEKDRIGFVWFCYASG
jgi:hypothetical protein